MYFDHEVNTLLNLPISVFNDLFNKCNHFWNIFTHTSKNSRSSNLIRYKEQHKKVIQAFIINSVTQ